MSYSNTNSLFVALLEQEDGARSRWKKVLDLKEAKSQVLFALPMIVTNVSYYFIPLVSVMFAGHLGELELAASNLANSWSTVTGLAFMIGLSGALETLCGQGYGAQLYRNMGIYLQASCIISNLFAIIISVIWIFTEPILILLHQDSHISKKAATYIRFLIPGIFAYGFIHNILRFLQTQSVVVPLVICSVLPLLIHIGIAYALVHLTPLGFEGAALAASVSLWLSAILLVFYVLFAKKFNQTWKGFSLESLHHVLSNLKLALPSAAMVCLEYWAFEILVILAGLMKNSAITTSLIAMCVNTETIAFMVTYGLSAAASTRVANELGADNVNAAKHATNVTLKLSILLSLVVVLALFLGRRAWAHLFSDSPVIINKFASITPFVMISIIFDSVQGVLSGVARGCGWQHWAVCINLTMFYLIGMPIAALLAFKLHLEAKGLWIGLICGLGFQAVGMLLVMKLSKWSRMKLSDDQTPSVGVATSIP